MQSGITDGLSPIFQQESYEEIGLGRMAILNRVIFFFIFFLFLLSHAQGDRGATEGEEKRAWRETGLDLNFFREKMGECHISEKNFSACMMAFHELVLNLDENNPQQVRVSGSNKLEIAPYPEKDDDFKIRDGFLLSQKKRRESFRTFFHSQAEREQTGGVPSIKEISDSLLQQSVELIKGHFPQEDWAYVIGNTYNIFLSEAVDPHAGIYPVEMASLKDSKKYAGIGVHLFNEHKETIKTGVLVGGFVKDSPAEAAGLRKGDLIVAIDDVPLHGKPVSDGKIAGDEGVQVKLTVENFCDGGRRDIEITRQFINFSTDFETNSHFVSLSGMESLGCEDDISVSGQADLQALYVPMKSFPSFPTRLQTLRLCEKFIGLQKMDMENRKSFGMIIDLRGNGGGSLGLVMCMLNTLIHGTEVLLNKVPVKKGELIDGETTSTYFTDEGFIPDSMYPLSYNKPVIVLVDRFSSSSSEFFAGTIQDMKRGWVVGERTAGKGSVQETSSFTLPGSPDNKPLFRRETTGLYTLNSGRSPQYHGIIPDFHFSRVGEFIDGGTDYVSFGEIFHFNGIDFEGVQWEQNRPDELARLSACVHQDNMIGFLLKKKIENDERYRWPLVDYHLELAKDILVCLPSVPSYGIRPVFGDIYFSAWGRKDKRNRKK